MESPQTTPEHASLARSRGRGSGAQAAARVEHPGGGGRRRRVAVLFVVGFTGLFANPVKGVNSHGTTTLSGTFEP